SSTRNFGDWNDFHMVMDFNFLYVISTYFISFFWFRGISRPVINRKVKHQHLFFSLFWSSFHNISNLLFLPFWGFENYKLVDVHFVYLNLAKFFNFFYLYFLIRNI